LLAQSKCTPQTAPGSTFRHCCSEFACLPVAQPKEADADPPALCACARTREERDRLANPETQRLGFRFGIGGCRENRTLDARSGVQHKSRLENLRLELFYLIV